MFKHFGLSLVLLFALCSCARRPSVSQPLPLAIGTYTEKLGHVTGTASGIYLADFYPETGEIKLKDSILNIINPSFLAFSPNGRLLYAVAETGGKPTQPQGEVCAFAYTEGGHWQGLNRVSSQGIAPCFVSVDKTGKRVYVANYVTGHAVAFRTNEQGALADSMPLKGVLKGGWAHYFKETPDAKRAIWVDKGADRLFVFDKKADTLLLAQSVALPSGAGPRHLDFHPNGRFVYVVNELSNTVFMGEYVSETGQITWLQTVSTLPSDFVGQNTAADIHVSPDGQWLLASNRGHESLALFRIDGASGRLTGQGFLPAEGLVPRNFTFAPSGHLLVAHQNSHSIAVFEQKGSKWLLKKNNTQIPTPVCLAFNSILK